MPRYFDFFSGLRTSCAIAWQCDLTAKDMLKLLPCLLWTLLSAILFTAYLSGSLIGVRWIPSFTVMLSLLNSIPSFMCGLLVIFFMRESVLRRGLDRSSMEACKTAMLFVWIFTVIAGSVITISFLVLAFKCDPDVAVSGGVAQNIVLLVCLVSWLVILIAIHPRASFLHYLLTIGEEYSRNQAAAADIVVGSVPLNSFTDANLDHYKSRAASSLVSEATWVSPHTSPSSGRPNGTNGVGMPELIGQPMLADDNQRSNFEMENGSYR